MRKNIAFHIRFILLLWIFCLGCGYRFTGSGNFPADVSTVFISIFKNHTSETGVENIFTNDLIYEITRNRKDLLTVKDKADALLSGVIESISIETISRKGINTSLERRVTVAVSLQLTDRKGKVIWSAKRILAKEAYDVASDKMTTEQNRRDAISVLSKRVAEKAYNRLTDDF